MLKGVPSVEVAEGHHTTVNEMQRTRSGKVHELCDKQHFSGVTQSPSLKMLLLLVFLAEGAEYGGENLIREESLEAESQEERTSDTAGEKINSQPEEEEQTSSAEQSSLDPEVEHMHTLYPHVVSLF